MNVSDRSALDLVRGFARIEFALKQLPEFVRGQAGETPDTQWSAYYPIARPGVTELVSREAQNVLLGTHPNDHPPRRMIITAAGGVVFHHQELVGPRGDRLLDAARRVRNNLVHGGKEFAHQERYPGHDQRLVDAAIEVIRVAAGADDRIARFFFAP